MSKAVKVTTATFEDQVLLAEGPVIVDFYADWCGPCKMLSPVLEQLAIEHTEVKIAKVNVDEEPALAERYRVRRLQAESRARSRPRPQRQARLSRGTVLTRADRP
jgi:thioredoxin 1